MIKPGDLCLITGVTQEENSYLIGTTTTALKFFNAGEIGPTGYELEVGAWLTDIRDDALILSKYLLPIQPTPEIIEQEKCYHAHH